MFIGRHSRRRAVAGVLAAVLIFGMLFTAGIAYFTYQAATLQSQDAANVSRQLAIQQSNLEKISLSTIVSGNPGAYTVSIVAQNLGGVALTIVADYATFNGQVIAPGVTTVSPQPSLSVGQSVTLSLTNVPDSSGKVSVITARGNTFSTAFPQTLLSTTTTVSTTGSATATTTTAPGTAGTNTLVTQMVATPPVTYSCNNCVQDNVTLYNYATSQITGIALSPSPPTIETCANTAGCTATLTSVGCTGPYNSAAQSTTNTIPAYSGSGNAPDIFYLCTYNANTGNIGGFASFSGYATGTLSSAVIASAEAISNTIQIGGSANVLSQGAFSVNFFVFKYTSCTNQPSGSQSQSGGTGDATGPYKYTTPCTTTPATIPPAQFHQLGNASIISAGSNQYLALYFTVTNDFNSTLPILKYSFVQFESALSLGEADLSIVGGPNNQSSIYPNYCQSAGTPACTSSDLPIFSAYTATAASCAETQNSNGVYEPPATTCINVSPGKSAVLTFAACGPGSSYWEWGGTHYASLWDPGTSGCTTTHLSLGTNGAPTALTLSLSYLYKNVVYTEDVAFQSTALIP